MIGVIRQAAAALRVSTDSLRARPRHALLVSAGLLIASFTLLVILTIPAGLQQLVGRTGSEHIGVVLADAGFNETNGNIPPELVDRIAALPGISRNTEGLPKVAPQLVVTTKLQRKDGSSGTLLVRGVPPSIWDVVGPAAQLTEGTAIQAGTMEVVSGTRLPAGYPFTGTGSELRLIQGSMSSWQVRGEFQANGGLWESELWADLENLRAEFNAEGQSTTVWVALESDSAFDSFSDAMRKDPRLRGFNVIRQETLYQMRVAFLSQFSRVGAITVAIVLGMMAVLAGNSTVGLMLRARRRELATLRAIGFKQGPLFIAILVEIMLLAGFCAAGATLLVWILLPTHEIQSTSGMLSVGFNMTIAPQVVALTLSYTLLLGVAAALIPAWRTLAAPLAASLTQE